MSKINQAFILGLMSQVFSEEMVNSKLSHQIKKECPYSEAEIAKLNSFGKTSPERKQRKIFQKMLQDKYKSIA